MFPLAAAVNFFSVTGLLVLSGLLGKSDLAADIAVTQGAVIAVFLSLSGNARNLILGNPQAPETEKSLILFRLIIMGPAALIVFFLTTSALDVSIMLLIGLILRKCCEWVAELQLANRETGKDPAFAFAYVLINSLAFVALAIVLILPLGERFFHWGLILWSVTPLVLIAPYLRHASNLGHAKVDFLPLLPHMGSTVAIGVSTYVFRVLVILLAGKLLAGQLFTAFALGGFVSSLYVYAFGPTLMLGAGIDRYRPVFVASAACLVFGIIIVALALVGQWQLYSENFLPAIGISLMGGGIMILAQSQRLNIIQNLDKDVFVADAASNILLISSVPFAFFVFGEISLQFLFLWSALLNFLFFVPMAMKARLETVKLL